MSDLPRLTTALEQRYRIERQLGFGGMATVYLATDLKHDREVALKVLRPELGAVLGPERFLAEIKIAARLDHPHILTLIDSGVDGGFLYYVMPFVRGETLRDKLNREQQLGLEDAKTITRHIASALDYAHRMGIVHRDIKPENILLQEGEAMLADFGIAIAVKEAGGSRLTETGLSLGTPQYMSPEQATGDRQLDARSDVYSLAAVLYEMLAGEPPVTGPNAQAMIAKLMMEQPTHLRVVRSSVPETIDRAVAKALDKTPADRFATAGEFMRAVDAAPPVATGVQVSAASPKGSKRVMIGAAVLVVAGLAAAAAAFTRTKPSSAGYELRDRVQLTTTGNVFGSVISADGKQIAIATRECGTSGCLFNIDLQDVGSTGSRRVLTGATSYYGLEWSPDRRNMIFGGTIGGRFGAHLLSALGGPTRFLTTAGASFWGGGDSLLIAPDAVVRDSVFQVKVTALDGIVRDSIRVTGDGQGIEALSVTPGGKWIVALTIQNGKGFWQVFDRSGTVADQVLNSCTCPGRISREALWLSRAGEGFESLIRIGLDPVTGRLAADQDTLLSGAFRNFSVTADGGTIVLDDGAEDIKAWAVSTKDGLQGNFADDRMLVQSSSRFNGRIAPSGERVVIERDVATADGTKERRFSIAPFAGGAEQPLTTPLGAQSFAWIDSVTGLVQSGTADQRTLSRVDVRTGRSSAPFLASDAFAAMYPGAAAALPDGYAWLARSGDKVFVERGGARSTIPMPAGFLQLTSLAADAAGERLVLSGWNAPSADSLMVAVVPTSGGPATLWARVLAEGGRAQFLPDGSLFVSQYVSSATVAMLRLAAPGSVERLGILPRPVNSVSVSDDLSRMLLVEGNRRADAYLSRVVKP